MHHTFFTQPSVGRGTEQVKNPYPITTLPDGTAWLSLHSLRCSAHQTMLLSLLSLLPALSFQFSQLGCAPLPKPPLLPEQNYDSTSIPCSWDTEHCLYVHWVVIWCLSCFFFGWTLHFSFLRAPECCIFWTVAWRHFKLRQSDASAHNHLGNKH